MSFFVIFVSEAGSPFGIHYSDDSSLGCLIYLL